MIKKVFKSLDHWCWQLTLSVFNNIGNQAVLCWIVFQRPLMEPFSLCSLGDTLSCQHLITSTLLPSTVHTAGLFTVMAALSSGLSQVHWAHGTHSSWFSQQGKRRLPPTATLFIQTPNPDFSGAKKRSSLFGAQTQGDLSQAPEVILSYSSPSLEEPMRFKNLVIIQLESEVTVRSPVSVVVLMGAS